MIAGLKQYAILAVAGLSVLVVLTGAPAVYAEHSKKPASALPDKFKFMGTEVTRHLRTYVVTKAVNIRAKPMIKSKRIGKLKKHQRIQTVGKAPGTWVAVRDGETDVGFVYAPMLVSVINGELDAPVSGKVSKSGHPACDYSIRFVGKSEAEGQFFKIADYDVHWKCDSSDGPREFMTPMFMTEGPYRSGKKMIHQVTIDIVDAGGNFDEVVSTTTFYNLDNHTLSFDGISVKRFSSKPDVLEVFAQTVPKALEGAVNMTYEAWTKPVWKILMKEFE